MSRDTAGVSAQNVELVRRFLSSLNKCPEEVRAAVAGFCDSDVDYYPVRKFPEARPCHGREEFSDFLTSFPEAFSHFRWEIRELIAVGGDRVLSCLNLRAEGRESGINLEGDMFQCVWLRHGRSFRIEDHLTLSRALRALGLEGETLEAAGLRAPSNVDLVRSIFAAWERGDYSSAAWAHPEIELVFADGPSPGSWTGLAGLAEGWRGVLSAWEEYRHEADEYRELDGERVLVLHHWSGRGKTSGLEVGRMRAQAAILFHVHDGKVTRLVGYFDRERAFTELGLSSEGGSAVS
jgi:ketosteroid isomerase-like protein